jgi:hypothetical protein
MGVTNARTRERKKYGRPEQYDARIPYTVLPVKIVHEVKQRHKSEIYLPAVSTYRDRWLKYRLLDWMIKVRRESRRWHVVNLHCDEFLLNIAAIFSNAILVGVVMAAQEKS